MREYKNKISLTQTSRGVWGLDPFKGCNYGMLNNSKGCYDTCYAFNVANARGFNFSQLVYRDFEDHWHEKNICHEVKRLPFVRLGVMCDPSSDWEHTLKIVDKIRPYQNNIVIITKHWTRLTQAQKTRLKGLTINTSISALDKKHEIKNRLNCYYDLKKYCSSILRVNSVDCNNKKLKTIQDKLLNSDDVINNILRFNKNNSLVLNGIVNIKKVKFLKSYSYASIVDNNVYFSDCHNCPDKCGIKKVNTKYQQPSLFQ